MNHRNRILDITKGIAIILYVSNLFAYLGKNTMIIYTWHVLVFKVVELLLSKMGLTKMSCGFYGEYSSNDYFLLYALFGVTIPVCFIVIYNNVKFVLEK